jgi:polyphosphate kinase
MKNKPNRFFNRELSWLDFNRRVLEEAKLSENPLLERLKFLAITASNLDEFFMVRVGGLQMMRKAGRRTPDCAGLTPRQQLREIRKSVLHMLAEQQACLNELETLLRQQGIRRIRADELNPEQERFADRLTQEELLPVLTPVALEDDAPPPAFQNLRLYMMIRVAPEADGGPDRFAVLPLGKPFGRIIDLPCESGHHDYTLLEDLVRRKIAAWFDGVDVRETALFRITRNADLAVREDEAADLLAGMAHILEERRWSDCVRIEVESNASAVLRKKLCTLLDTDPENLFRIDGLIHAGDLMPLCGIEGFTALKAPAQNPQPSPAIDSQEPLFKQIADRDLLLYHPYESFSPVLRLIREAADDPDVLAIKQVLYRTSAGSPVIAALTDAARAGKSVTVLIELKARFDEQRNIDWAQLLERAGVQVVYGVHGLKTHAKVCLIIRKEPQGITRYVHYGTGNYNDATARLYGDISYMTGRPDLGADASQLFHAVCGYSEPTGLRKANMAPLNLRDRLIELIDSEIERSRQKQKGRIWIKLNSLADICLIEKLYDASRAGVKIHLNVRGICCLRPGLPKLSENITVTSIVGRYLEHARIFCFHQGGDEKVFISSADWMPRNLDRRVELLIPVEEKNCRERLIRIVKTHCSDTVKSWTLLSDGTSVRTATLPGRRKKINSQQLFYDEAVQAVADAAKRSRTALRPHRPQKAD